MGDDVISNLEVFCTNWGLKLEPNADPFWKGIEPMACALYGSISRQLNLTFEDRISIKNIGGKKIIFKWKYGTEPHRDTNTVQEKGANYWLH